MRYLLVLCAVFAFAGCATPAVEGTGGTPVFFPAPPAEARIQFLATLNGAADIEERSGLAEFVLGGRTDLIIGRPHGTAWHDGSLYVCDPGAGALLRFDFYRHVLSRLLIDQPGAVQKPLEIAIAPDGWKYVVDANRKLVVVLDDENRYRTTIGDPENWRPVGIAAGPERLYVSDVKSHQIVEFDRKSGKKTAVIGEQGGGSGQFNYPVGVSLGRDGDLWVTDSFNFRVQRLHADGTAVGEIGGAGDGPGRLARPKSTAVDRGGLVYIADGAFENIQVFDSEHRLLLYFGAPGDAPGSMNIPAHVTISYSAVDAFADRVAEGFDLEYVIFVSNQIGPQRINVYGLLRSED